MRVRRRGGHIAVAMTATEAALLRSLVGQALELLRESPAGAAEQPDPADPTQPVDPLEAMAGTPTEPVAAPEDPALLRLLPDAYAEDPAAAGEFRRLMDADLRGQKAAALTMLLGSLPGPEDGSGSASLTPDLAAAWLQALNDIRLVLGVRLDVQEDMTEVWESLTRDDPRLPLFYAYERITFLQQEILEAVANTHP